MSVQPQLIARMIDHTYLKPDATSERIRKLCAEAKQYHFCSVCVNSVWVPFCVDQLKESAVHVAAVVGFPLGASASAAKAFEAAEAAKQGAKEIDMVLHVGWLLDASFDRVRKDIAEVVNAVRGQAIVKVILETGYLNDEQKKIACVLSEEAGAHYVKTSTGFGPGGATAEDVRLMRGAVSASIGVKASGGIRDAETAKAMIEAGANRLGTSSGIAIVTGSATAGGTAY